MVLSLIIVFLISYIVVSDFIVDKSEDNVNNNENVSDNIKKMVISVVNDVVIRFTTEKYVEDWDFESLTVKVNEIFAIPDFIFPEDRYNGLTQEELIEELTDKVMKI